MGIERSTFLVGADGKIAKIFSKVKPEGHAEQLVPALVLTVRIAYNDCDATVHIFAAAIVFNFETHGAIPRGAVEEADRGMAADFGGRKIPRVSLCFRPPQGTDYL